jgi:hypothetical protein
VWNESKQWVGPAFAELPAALREQTVTSCYSNTPAEFWLALGAKIEYEFSREGNEYIIVVDGIQIKACEMHACVHRHNSQACN